MRSSPIIIAAIVAMGSPATAQSFVTPQAPLGQGFVPNGSSTTPSNPSSPIQSTPQLNEIQQPSTQAGPSILNSQGPSLNSVASPNETGRALPQGPLGGPEHPAGPLR
jgi:hypothetical protein